MRVSELLLSESPLVPHTVETMLYLLPTTLSVLLFTTRISGSPMNFKRTRWEAGVDEKWRPLIPTTDLS